MKKAFPMIFFDGIILKLKKLLGRFAQQLTGLSPLSVVPASASILPGGRTLCATPIGRRSPSPVFASAIVFSALLFAGCGFFSDEGMGEVFSRSTEVMSIVRMDLTGNSAVDKEGVKSIPSQSSYSVDYIVKNPQGFSFTAKVTNAADTVPAVKALVSQKKAYTWNVSEDFTKVTVVLSQEMLTLQEMGGPVTPIVQIECPEYGNAIPEYFEDIRSNSLPPTVQCAVAMVNTAFRGNYSIGKYVLCFNLPDVLFDCGENHTLNGIHSDVMTIRVEGLEDGTSGASQLSAKNGISLDLEWNESLSRWTYNDILPPSPSTSLSVNTYNNVGVNRSNGMPAATFYPGNHPVYILDNRYARDGESCKYKITMTDKLGLESTLTVATDSKQLCPVTISDGYGSEMTMDEKNNIHVRTNEVTKDQTFTMVLNAPKRTLGAAFDYVDDAEVIYSIYGGENSSSLSFIAQGSSVSKFQYVMRVGWSYKIQAYAHRSGYIDSALSEWMVHVGMEDVEIEVLYCPMQYFVGFSLDPYAIYPTRDDLDSDYRIKCIMKVYDIDKVNEMFEKYSITSSDEARDEQIRTAMEEALVTSGYTLSNFKVRFMDIETPFELETDVSKLGSGYVYFVWPEEYMWTPGLAQYQVYVNVDITNIKYGEGEKAYCMTNSALLKLVVENPD